jgi:hypothetical protein
MASSLKKNFKREKIIKIIEQEVAGLKEVLYQKSADFRDNHIYQIGSFSELEKKIKEELKGLFLIPFCNNLNCEAKIKERVPSYSIRCIASERKTIEPSQCLFCQLTAKNMVYLGRSY